VREKTDLFSIAEISMNEKIADTLWSFLFCSLATMSRNLVQIFNNNVAFCLSVQCSKFNVDFGSTCATRCKLLGTLPKF